MKYGAREVVDLIVFNEEGSKITELNTLKESRIYLDECENIGYVVVKDALLDSGILRFIHKEDKNKLTDYEKYFNNKNTKTVVVNGIKSSEKCKLISSSVIRDASEYQDVKIIFEIPNALALRQFKYKTKIKDGYVGEFDLVFEIKPFNGDGDLFKIHIEE